MEQEKNIGVRYEHREKECLSIPKIIEAKVSASDVSPSQVQWAV